MIRTPSHFRFLYPIIFLSVTSTAFLLIVFFDSKIFNYVIPLYFVLVFGLILLRYLLVLISVSIMAKESIPELYEKHMGFSRFKNIQIVSPTIVFEKMIKLSGNQKLILLNSELKYLLVLLVLSFVAGTALAILIAI